MGQERKSRFKILLWVVLAVMLHYTAIVTMQAVVTFVFSMQDIATGVLTMDMTSGDVFYQGELLTDSAAYIEKYGVGTSSYVTILALPLVFLGLFIFHKIQKKPLGAGLAINKFPAVSGVLGFILGVSIYFPVAYIVSNTFLSELSTGAGTSMETMLQYAPFWVMALAMAIVAPIMEELVFRGFIYKTLEEGTDNWYAELLETYGEMKDQIAQEENGDLKEKNITERLEKIKRRLPLSVIVTQAVIFGAVHMDLQQFVYATALGLLFGLMRYYTKSVWPGILAHIGFNAFSVALFWIAKNPDSSISKALLNLNENVFLLITVVVFAIALLLFEIVVKNRKICYNK